MKRKQTKIWPTEFGGNRNKRINLSGLRESFGSYDESEFQLHRQFTTVQTTDDYACRGWFCFHWWGTTYPDSVDDRYGYK